MFTCIDLFSGAGGLSCGLIKEGIESKVAVEIEKDFAETFKLNHKNVMLLMTILLILTFIKLQENKTLEHLI